MESSRKKILITGGAGFVGYYLTKHLVAVTDADLLLVDNLERGRMDAELTALVDNPRVAFQKLDLTDPVAWTSLGGGYDYVYHLAAVNGTRHFYERPDEVLRTNTLSLFHFLDWMGRDNKDGKFCFTSSNEAYAGALSAFGVLPLPTPENVPLVIDDPYNPRWSYAATKLVGELACIHYAAKKNLRGYIVRPHNFYGERAGYDHVIPQFAERIAARQDPFVVKGSDETRSFCHIEDAVRAMRLLMESPSTDGQPIETVHIGTRDEISMRDLAGRMFAAAGWQPKAVTVESAPAGSVKRRLPDISKLERLTNWKQEISLDEGLKRAYLWYKDHPKPIA